MRTFYIKKRILFISIFLLCLFITSCAYMENNNVFFDTNSTVFSLPESSLSDNKFEPYIKFIQDNFENKEQYATQYQLGLIDLDENGVPELVIENIGGWGENQSIYRISGDSLVLVCTYPGGFSTSYSKKFYKMEIKDGILWRFDFKSGHGFSDSKMQNIIQVQQNGNVERWHYLYTILSDNDWNPYVLDVTISHNNDTIYEDSMDLKDCSETEIKEFVSGDHYAIVNAPEWTEIESPFVMESNVYGNVGELWGDLSFESLEQRLQFLYQQWETL